MNTQLRVTGKIGTIGITVRGGEASEQRQFSLSILYHLAHFA